ncbi:MAG: glycosyltransferase [Candidatus Nanoarchaeia archaeon]|nr:glycosyltransferase [Candidatus Nanoarchaeia archaeon]
MAILPYVYLGYMFISLYMLSMFLIIYLKNKKEIFDYPKAKKKYAVSFVVPAYNEEKTIEDTIKNIFNVDYDMLEVIVVNDGSTDNTKKIIEKLMKEYPKLKLINNIKNLGNAARSQNVGLKHAKGEIIAVVDADSYPSKDSVSKMLGFFNDEKVGAVTCPVIARNTNRFIEKLQAIEYKMISLTRKLLDYVDAIYVTPGPLALYRKKVLVEIGGFDENNMTQDIEATWHLTYNGWMRRMCLSASVSSTVPNKLKAWFRQRRRWNVGGLQCIQKYRKSLFDPKKGMLGFFIIPFFILSTFLGLLGLSIFSYLIIKRTISNFLYTKYSIVAGTPLLTLENFYITPSILNYLGVALFILGLIFLFIVFAVLKERVLRKENILNIPFYMMVYIAFYPFIMLSAMWHMAKGKRIWR